MSALSAAYVADKPMNNPIDKEFNEKLFAKFSSYTTLLRTIARCLRFAQNCKTAKHERNCNFLTAEELKNAEQVILRNVQKSEFFDEIQKLKANKPIKKDSKLVALTPFLDNHKLLRVGGRLHNANLSWTKKHQIILPPKNHITNLIIKKAHLTTLHGGEQKTQYHIQQKYWVINAKSRINCNIKTCVPCFKYNIKTHHQLMCNLPLNRVSPSPPFAYSGVDFAGPFQTRMSKGRGTKTQKGYICVFVCMVTKAIHLELVSDLSTNAFIAAYKRFTARRGNCVEIQSDNGTNFVGANSQLNKDVNMAIKQATAEVASIIANDGTTWKFIPVASPHFGGLWEAGVKAVKSHLKKTLSETTLTFEEFCTVLYQVEACLNSRPLTPLSNDPKDLQALTPGHFLIGRKKRNF